MQWVTIHKKWLQVCDRLLEELCMHVTFAQIVGLISVMVNFIICEFSK